MKKSRKSKKYKVKLSIPAQILVFISILIIYIINFSGIFNIKHIQVLEQNQVSNNSNIQNLLIDLNKNNLILTKTNNIKTRITNQYPQINNLKITKSYPDTLIINFDKFKTLAYVNDKSAANGFFTINETGILENQNEKPINLPELLIPQKNLVEGMQVITTEKIQYMVDAYNHFKAKLQINIQQIKYLPQAQEIHFILDNNTQIWIDTTYDYKNQINKLIFAKENIDLNTQYQHIDLRIKSAKGHKIFYK